MNPIALALFVCPQCRSPGLEMSAGGSPASPNSLSEGRLICKGCDAIYRLHKGIPRFVPGGDYAESFGFQWNKFQKTQLDSFTGLPLSQERLFYVTKWPRTMKADLVLEAGSGAGRFTEVLLSTGATVFSFDLSNAVEANAANNSHLHNLNLFQASIYDIPLREGVFDKVLCLGVLQHTPDPERAFVSLVGFLKPGGEIAIDIYARRFRSLISWKYLLRPLTRRMAKDRLFRLVEISVNVLLPTTILLRRIAGRWGARLMPIMDWSNVGLPYELNREWSILDTFDMYSPAHDHPHSVTAVRRWFEKCGLEDVVVEYGPNGVNARGRRQYAHAARELSNHT